MDIASVHGRGAVVLAALVVAACSSSSSTSSSNGGDSPGDGGLSSLSQDGGGGTPSNYDAAVDYDATIAACAGYPSAVNRQACCEQEIPRGYLVLHVAQQGCLCGASGACTSACNYQDCTSLQGSTPTCQSCIDSNLAGSCKATVASACAADPGCVAYQACLT